VNVQASLWRSIAVFRVASLAYAAVLIVVDRADYKHLGWAWAVLAGMAAWTAFTSAAYAVPARRTRLLLAAELELHNRGELIRYAIEHGLDYRPGPDSGPG
jgi:uncharacterized protein DUF5931